MRQEYTADQIRALTGREAVRLRPGMYVGDKDEGGLHQLVYELVDNAFDEAVEGFGKRIYITIHPNNSVTVADEGRGIPVAIYPSKNRPTAELLLTSIHLGGKFESDAYKVKKGLHGVGAACVNFLSEWLHLEIRREGKCYRQSYQTGIPTMAFTNIGPTSETGTTITFNPDASIFTVTEFNVDRLAGRLREKAFLNKGVEIKLIDERSDPLNEMLFCFPNGLADFARFLCKDLPLLHPEPIHFEGAISQTDQVEVALMYTNHHEEKVFSFANQIPTPDGGTHLSGFCAGLTRVINQYAKSFVGKPALKGKDIRLGLVAVIATTEEAPRFERSTKSSLQSDIQGVVQSFVYQNLTDYFAKQPDVANAIVQHLQQNATTIKQE
jgi:DNA gyrase subunit B